MSNRFTVVAGGILGLLSVALGAYFEHGLKGSLDPDSFNSMQIALRHQQLHSVVILALGLACCCELSPQSKRWLRRAALLMVAGVVIFSGSIYLTYGAELKELRRLAPMGGILTMFGWLAVILCGLTGAKKGSA